MGLPTCGLLVAGVRFAAAAAANSAPSLPATQEAENLEVVSMTNRLDKESLRRANLLADFPLKVHILGLGAQSGQGWTNLRKLTLMHEHVKALSPEKVVFVLDFFDVVWLGCSRDLVATFRSFARPLVFGAEFHPYPLTNESLARLPGGYPLLTGSGRAPKRLARRGPDGRFKHYRYLNSGCIAGYASALTRAVGRMIANNFDNEYVLQTPLAQSEKERHDMQVGRDDQVAWHAYALRHPEEVALDYRAELFLNSLGFHLQHFELREGEVWSRDFGHPLCFAHGNGASNTARWLRSVQDLGVQPSRCTQVTAVQGRTTMYDLVCAPPVG